MEKCFNWPSNSPSATQKIPRLPEPWLPFLKNSPVKFKFYSIQVVPCIECLANTLYKRIRETFQEHLLLFYYFLFFLVGRDWVHLALRTLFGLLYQPQMIDEGGDCGTIGGMRIGRGNRNTRRKPTPVPLCPPQIPHDLTRARTRAAAVGSRWLTTWAIARTKEQWFLCVPTA
jgi:hypothetical protein